MIKICSILRCLVVFFLLAGFLMAPGWALMLRKTLQELTYQADTILIGEVRNMESRWNEERTLIYTYITIWVKEYSKALAPVRQVQEIIVKVRGGEVGDIGLRVSDTPQFREGEEVFLFLSSETLPVFLVVGLFQGKYTIEEGKVKNRILGLEIPLESFIGQIEVIMKRAEGSQ